MKRAAEALGSADAFAAKLAALADDAQALPASDIREVIAVLTALVG